MKRLLIGLQVALAGFVALTVPLITIREVASQTPPVQGANTSADMATAVKGSNAFAVDLYAKLRKQQDGNLFFSPYSLSTALAMTYAGTRGETATEIAKVLHFTLGQERLHPAFSELISELTADQQQKYQLVQANRFWGQKGYGFLQPFLQTAQKYYGAGLEEVDFVAATEKARNTINNWVAQQTQNKIQNLFPTGILNRLTRFVLTNAIYFKATWDVPFKPQGTRDALFTIKGGQQIQVPMMESYKSSFRHAQLDNLQILELTYASNKLSMIILLPNKVDGLAELEQQLTTDNLENWLLTFPARQEEGRNNDDDIGIGVKVYLPKFKITSEFKLNQVLSEMGMPLAFSGRADLSGVSGEEEDLFISAVVHKAVVNVDEVGTEAAAATGVGGETLSGAEYFRIDHPFIFLIRDNESGCILFLGRIVNPLAKS